MKNKYVGIEDIDKEISKSYDMINTFEKEIEEIYKLTKENINLKTQNQALIMQFFLKGDNNQ